MKKQKIAGAAIIAVSIAPILAFGDATMAVFFAPLGLYTLFTKNEVIK